MDRIFRTDKNNPFAIVLSAFLLSSTGQDKMALSRIEDALCQDVGLAYAYFLRAGIRERHLQFDLADEDYESATKWKPDFIMAFVNHGLVAEKRGQTSMAVDFFKKALELVDQSQPTKILFAGGTDISALKAMLRGKVQ
jgi:Tfp pilus assembly protein PilF